ncbi:MAG TPA: alcohol dehydrogenase catalytic domain-containing protein [Clostridiales bacterium]|nr:alcohol dehydrogenase catalytic domain-containing protein [Clostridiales bacterium]
MKALRYLDPNQLSLEDVKEPVVRNGEVLLKVRACGICGSDVHGALGLTGRRIPPMTMGHEFTAEVVELGMDAAKFKVGDGVIVQPINFCGECINCEQGLTNMCLNKKFFGVLTVDGAMAEYVAVPEKLLYKLPEGTSYEVGALAEPYAVAYGAVKKLEDYEGKSVLIIGAGAIGLCVLQLVKLKNPKQIIVSDLSDARLKVAKEFGADHTINPKNEDYMEAIERYTDGVMIDISIEAVGVQPTANQSIKSLRVGGTSIWVGMSQKEMEINMQDIVCSAREVLGSFNYTHEEFGEVVDIIGNGKMEADKLISKVVSLKEAPQAFDDLHRRPDEFIKIIIDPTK